MNLLAAKLYDPTPVVTFGTVASVLAVFDTSNLRITFTVPASGYVRVVIECTLHGATTYSQILLGCLEGATVRGRVAPRVTQSGTALATTMLRARADYIVPGMTPGASVTWDAAWGIETFVASSLIKCGGAQNATANNDFGAIQFEIWDAQPQTTTGQLFVDASGRVDVAKVAGTTQTARDLGANLDAAVSTRSTYAGGAVASVTGAVGSVTGAVGSVTGAVGSVTGLTAADVAAIKAKTDNLPSDPADQSLIIAATDAVMTRIGLAGAGLTSLGDTRLANLNATISSRSSHTAADVWASGTRTVTSYGTLVADIVTAVWAAATRTLTAISDSTGVTTLLSRIGGVLTLTTGKVDVNDKTGFALAVTPPSSSTIASAVRTELGTELGRVDVAVSSVGASDPWETELPGEYADGTAGKLVGENLDAQVSLAIVSSSEVPDADLIALELTLRNKAASNPTTGNKAALTKVRTTLRERGL